MSEVLDNERELLYHYHPSQICGDGYYELKTKSGKFLGNVAPEELDQELRDFGEEGYII